MEGWWETKTIPILQWIYTLKIKLLLAITTIILFQFLLLNQTVAQSRKIKCWNTINISPLFLLDPHELKFRFHLINGEKSSLRQHSTKEQKGGWDGGWGQAPFAQRQKARNNEACCGPISTQEEFYPEKREQSLETFKPLHLNVSWNFCPHTSSSMLHQSPQMALNPRGLKALF